MSRQITARDLRDLTLPWGYQVLLFGALIVCYPLFVVAVYAGMPGENQANAIVAGSLVGAFPVFLLEVNEVLRKPHVRLIEQTNETPADAGIICKYPHRWFAHPHASVGGAGDEDVDGVAGDAAVKTHASVNAARLLVTLENDGWAKATRCRAWIRIEEPADDGAGSRYRFPVRWEREDNPLEMDLRAGERAEVMLSEVDLADRAFKTALSAKLSEEVQSTPHEYTRAERYEIEPGRHYRVAVQVTADGMGVVERPVDLGNGAGAPVEVPGFAAAADEWGVVDTLKQDGDRACAVWYREDGENVLQANEAFDLERLREAGPSGQSELEGPYLPDGEEGIPYRTTLEDAGFEIRSVDGIDHGASPSAGEAERPRRESTPVGAGGL